MSNDIKNNAIARRQLKKLNQAKRFAFTKNRKQNVLKGAQELQDSIDEKIKSVALDRFVIGKTSKLKALGKTKNEIDVLVADLLSSQETLLDKGKNALLGLGVDKKYVGLSTEEILEKVGVIKKEIAKEEKEETKKETNKSTKTKTKKKDGNTTINVTNEIVVQQDSESKSSKDSKLAKAKGKPLQVKVNPDTDNINDINKNNEKIYNYLIKSGEIDVANYILDLMTTPTKQALSVSDVKANTAEVKRLSHINKGIYDKLTELEEMMIDEQDTSIDIEKRLQQECECNKAIEGTKQKEDSSFLGTLLSLLLGGYLGKFFAQFKTVGAMASALMKKGFSTIKELFNKAIKSGWNIIEKAIEGSKWLGGKLAGMGAKLTAFGTKLAAISMAIASIFKDIDLRFAKFFDDVKVNIASQINKVKELLNIEIDNKIKNQALKTSESIKLSKESNTTRIATAEAKVIANESKIAANAAAMSKAQEELTVARSAAKLANDEIKSIKAIQDAKIALINKEIETIKLKEESKALQEAQKAAKAAKEAKTAKELAAIKRLSDAFNNFGAQLKSLGTSISEYSTSTQKLAQSISTVGTKAGQSITKAIEFAKDNPFSRGMSQVAQGISESKVAKTAGKALVALPFAGAAYESYANTAMITGKKEDELSVGDYMAAFGAGLLEWSDVSSLVTGKDGLTAKQAYDTIENIATGKTGILDPFRAAMGEYDTDFSKKVDAAVKKYHDLGIIDLDWMGTSEVNDWNAIRKLPPEEIAKILAYGDWDKDDRASFKNAIKYSTVMRQIKKEDIAMEAEKAVKAAKAVETIPTSNISKGEYEKLLDSRNRIKDTSILSDINKKINDYEVANKITKPTIDLDALKKKNAEDIKEFEADMLDINSTLYKNLKNKKDKLDNQLIKMRAKYNDYLKRGNKSGAERMMRRINSTEENLSRANSELSKYERQLNASSPNVIKDKQLMSIDQTYRSGVSNTQTFNTRGIPQNNNAKSNINNNINVKSDNKNYKPNQLFKN